MDFLKLKELIRSDYYRILNLPQKSMGGVKVSKLLYLIFFNPSFSTTFWFRLGTYLNTKSGLAKMLLFVVKYFSKRVSYRTGIQIPITVCAGYGLRFCHFSCIVITPGAVIGNNCTIHQGVTIGRSFAADGTGGDPIIGNNVVIFPGAKILGNVTIGDDAVVCANAVVT